MHFLIFSLPSHSLCSRSLFGYLYLRHASLAIFVCLLKIGNYEYEMHITQPITYIFCPSFCSFFCVLFHLPSLSSNRPTHMMGSCSLFS